MISPKYDLYSDVDGGGGGGGNDGVGGGTERRGAH